MTLPPIILFVYNRPWHTRQTLEALSSNELADKSELYIYADGPKTNADAATLNAINEVRKLIREKQWCGKVNIIESESNKGLAASIINGVTEIVNKHGKIIVLEDDIVPTTGFLKYMNEALELYEFEEKVMHISSFWPKAPIRKYREQTFFLRFMSCWGWATWKDSWRKLNTDIMFLYHNLINNKYDFNLSDTSNMFKQIELNISGELNTWAIKWYASIYINNGLCLFPYKSLVKNIGIDGSGVHFTNKKTFNPYKTKIINNVIVSKIDLNENFNARKALESFYYKISKKSILFKLKKKLVGIIKPHLKIHKI